MSNFPSYAIDLPTEEELRYRLSDRIDFWRPRNEFIKLARQMVNGKNPIRVPKTSQYKPIIQRTYMLAGAVSEKRARFLQRPVIQVIPDRIGMDAQSAATDLEHGLNALMEEIDRNSDGNNWDALVEDAIFLDCGVECIERAPAAFWPELIVQNGEDVLSRLFEDPEAYTKAKREYKRQAGVPIRNRYVMLEDYLPTHEARTTVEAMEFERRSLRSVLHSPMFRPEAKAFLAGYETGPTGGLGTNVTIVRYCNQWVYAYYALAPVKTNYTAWPTGLTATEENVGTPVLLHAYPHKLGMVLYNEIAGRYGGWKRSQNQIEPVIRALLELNAGADRMLSQVVTNIGARFWPNLKWQLNPEYRIADGNTPKPPKLTDGEPIPLFIGEDLKPVFENNPNDPMVQWAYQKISEQFSRLAGSPTQYGERQPGVNTGYQQSLQITQSEHLDEKIESNLSIGVRNRMSIIAGHIKAMDESIEVARHEVNKKLNRHYTKWLTITPEQLNPLPRMDARVRKPKPTDFLSALRAARDASANRRGQGTPMLSDDTIYEMILGIDEPDVEQRKIWLQNESQKLLDSGFLSGRIAQRVNMQVAKEAPALAGDAAQKADPALIQAMQGQVQGGQVAQQGGVSPDIGQAVNGWKSGNQQPNDPGVRREGGTPAGNPQPEQAVANAVRVASQTARGTM